MLSKFYLFVGLVAVGAVVGLFLIVWGIQPKALSTHITDSSLLQMTTDAVVTATLKLDLHIMPTSVKGVYVTAYTAGNQARLDKIIDLMDRTELNAVVIDIKDYTGYILYDSHVPLAEQLHTSKNILGDVTALIRRLHEHGIYVIARQTVFQDPVLAKNNPMWAIRDVHGGLWRDRNGLAWVDASVTDVWDYNIAIAKEAAGLGFDEINFDYVRFPSDGVIRNMLLQTTSTKHEVMHNFYHAIGVAFASSTVKTSLDLFGFVMERGPNDDLGIGQRLVDAVDEVDYISPMMYPSHYPTVEGHETDRFKEMERVISLVDKGKPIDSKDHRVVQSIVMREIFFRGDYKVIYQDAPNKTWPGFWNAINTVLTHTNNQ
jgi:hypothetical protein